MEDTLLSLRAFNRFYTRFVGALDAHFLGTDLSLVEGRMLYEIATRHEVLATELQETLGLDAGYASRILRRFESKGWVARARGSDARRRPITLTASGQEIFADLDLRQRAVLIARLTVLGEVDRRTLGATLDAARGLLSGQSSQAYSVRTHRAGDMGMITARQAILYAESNGWGPPMEALIGEVTAKFLRDFQPDREACWIAERAGLMAGSVFVVDAGDGIAQLRLLYVEPDARGLGIGRDLVDRCVAFARDAGYGTLRLWTHTVLTGARKIYADAGFTLVSTALHDAFGTPEQGEIWEMPLGA